MAIYAPPCKVYFLIAVALGFLQFAFPPGRAQAGEARTPELQQLIEAAKAEGGRFIADAVDLMNQNQFASRLLKEIQAGRQPSTDVFNGTQSTIPRLMQGNALESVDNWQALLPRIPKEAIVSGGGALAERTRIGGCCPKKHKD